MIKFIKHYFSTPYIELTPQDKFGIVAIAVGAILVLSLITLAVGCLAVAIKNSRKRTNIQKKQRRKHGKKRKKIY